MNYPNKELIDKFNFEGEYFYCEPFGCGHINSTFAVYFKFETKPVRRYIIQKINKGIFTNPVALMENVDKVTSYLRTVIERNGGDTERETLTIIPTKEGKLLYEDADGEFWRAYIFIENAVCYQTVERPVLFTNAAAAFGNFQKMLADFPAETLCEIIPNFHNTESRFADFCRAVEEDRAGRVCYVSDEINFINARSDVYGKIVKLISDGKMPLRVTHNDTKLNNIMMDPKTDNAVCVIDLDTVMPGSALYDFGDSIRFGASSAAEDEKNLSSVYMVPELYEAYTKGFLREAKDTLTDIEIENLPLSAILMTAECGMRFLADYLNGDIYFKVHYDGQNLDRARTQIKLVADMENKLELMKQITAKYAK